jgi:hypothetical protein
MTAHCVRSVLRDGRIDVAVRPRTAPRFAVVRFLATGQVDSSFDDGGLAGAVNSGRLGAFRRAVSVRHFFAILKSLISRKYLQTTYF